MPEIPAIEVDTLCKTYQDGLFRRRQIAAFRGVSFRVERGTIFGLLGPNGAGKTTLVKVLLGIVRKSGGTAMLMGVPARDRRGRCSVGDLPRDPPHPPHPTATSAPEYFSALER